MLIHQSWWAMEREKGLGFESGEGWQLQQAQVVRDYVAGRKTWIHREEAS